MGALFFADKLYSRLLVMDRKPENWGFPQTIFLSRIFDTLFDDLSRFHLRAFSVLHHEKSSKMVEIWCYVENPLLLLQYIYIYYKQIPEIQHFFQSAIHHYKIGYTLLGVIKMFPSKEFFYVQSLMMVRWYLQHPLRNLWFQAKNTKLNLLLWLRSRPHQWGHRWDYATKAELLPWSILIWALVLWFYIRDLGWHQMILTILEEKKSLKYVLR